MLSFVIFYFGLRVCVSKFQFPGRLDFRAGYDWVGVISSFEGTDFARLRKDAEISPITLEASIDLGKSMSTVLLDEEGLHLGDQSGAVLCNWDEIAKICKKKNSCWALYEDGSAPWSISAMSSTTGNPASLCAPLDAGGAPTIILGGFTMHRIKGENMNPMTDTNNKLACIKIPKGGKVLDTCMGLGYTAIAATKEAWDGSHAKTITIEYDDVSLEMAAHNPWSSELFDPEWPIEIMNGDACSITESFESNTFDVIIHDPPARALCRTDLYGYKMYTNLHRICKHGGSIYHYIGNENSKESGRLFGGVMERLNQAGFRNVKKARDGFGVVAKK
jgi:predicted methyltransferase